MGKLCEWVGNLFKKKPGLQPPYEIPHASDIVPQEAIVADDEKHIVTLDFNKLNIPFIKPPVIWAMTIADTNSMDPTMDAPHNPIAIRGVDPENQQIMIDWIAKNYAEKGNLDVIIANFRWDKVNKRLDPSGEEMWIIHRVHEIQNTPEGRRWQLKGDNPICVPDPWILADSDIAYLTADIVY